MPEDVHDLLEMASGWYEPPYDGLDGARRRAARRRARRRVNSGVVGLLVFVLGFALFWGAFRTSAPGPAAADAPNYLLTVQSVRPSVDPQSGAIDRGKAFVEFTIDWSSSQYPGVHSCTVSAYGSDGGKAGSLIFELGSMTPTVHTSSVVVDVQELAMDATGVCDKERLDTPVAYLISNSAVEGDFDTGLSVVFDVAWPDDLPSGAYPADNACEAIITGESGEELAREHFTLGVGEGRFVQRIWLSQEERAIASSTDMTALSAEVRCEPWSEDHLDLEP